MGLFLSKNLLSSVSPAKKNRKLRKRFSSRYYLLQHLHLTFFFYRMLQKHHWTRRGTSPEERKMGEAADEIKIHSFKCDKKSDKSTWTKGWNVLENPRTLPRACIWEEWTATRQWNCCFTWEKYVRPQGGGKGFVGRSPVSVTSRRRRGACVAAKQTVLRVSTVWKRERLVSLIQYSSVQDFLST